VRGFGKDRDARHFQSAIEVLGYAEEFVGKDFVKDALTFAPAAVRARDDSFGYHSDKRPIDIVGDQRLSAPPRLPCRRRSEFRANAGVKGREWRATAQVLRRRVSIGRFARTVSQA
jgi:hypothetical protein